MLDFKKEFSDWTCSCLLKVSRNTLVPTEAPERALDGDA